MQSRALPANRSRFPRNTIRAAGGLFAGLLLFGFGSSADQAIVASTDFETAYYSSLDLEDPYTRDVDLGTICADPAVRVHGDRIYVLGRFGCDHVQVIDANSLQTLGQYSVGPGTNPQDIEVWSPTKAYVSRYDSDALLIMNPQNGASLGTVSLSVFNDADGLPEAAEMALVGNHLFVAVQRLDRFDNFRANNPSFLAVVDCTTDQLVDIDPGTPGVQGIPLTGRNPFSEIIHDPVRDKLYVAEVGNYGDLDGGAEFIDPYLFVAEGFFVTEATLGGDLNGVRLWMDCTGYAIVGEPIAFITSLVQFDHCTGAVLETCLQANGPYYSDVEIDRQGLVLVTDRNLVTPGVRILQAGGCTELASTLDFGLPPWDVGLVQPWLPTSIAPEVTQPSSAVTPYLLSNSPDPFNPSTVLRIEGRAGASARLEVHDIRGRRVRVLWSGILEQDSWSIVWDGRDDRGRAVPSGVYLARLSSGETTRTERMTLLR